MYTYIYSIKYLIYIGPIYLYIYIYIYKNIYIKYYLLTSILHTNQKHYIIYYSIPVTNNSISSLLLFKKKMISTQTTIQSLLNLDYWVLAPHTSGTTHQTVKRTQGPTYYHNCTNPIYSKEYIILFVYRYSIG